MKQLLRPSTVAKQLSQLLGRTWTCDDIDAAVNEGSVVPFAMAGVLPLFTQDQLSDIAEALTDIPARDFRHQVRPLRQAEEFFSRRGVTRDQLESLVDSGAVPFAVIDGVVTIHMPTVSQCIQEQK